MMLVYLAGPIDAVDQKVAKHWREDASDFLVAHGFTTYSPVHAFSGKPECLTPERADAIIAINNKALLMSNVVLANMDGVSYGTPIEVEAAYRNHIPVFGKGVNPNSIYKHHFHHIDDNINILLGAILSWRSSQ